MPVDHTSELDTQLDRLVELGYPALAGRDETAFRALVEPLRGVAAALPGNDPVHKITILPRGRALGYTMVLPDQDKHSTTRSDM